jgi:hypothetical protein
MGESRCGTEQSTAALLSVCAAEEYKPASGAVQCNRHRSRSESPGLLDAGKSPALITMYHSPGGAYLQSNTCTPKQDGQRSAADEHANQKLQFTKDWTLHAAFLIAISNRLFSLPAIYNLHLGSSNLPGSKRHADGA